ncbi:hypothetical protein LUZ60_008365 [Juncus effusus]|nr:hypothetical protein LUZ60_008365 [Juncus effusus]
MRIEQLDDGGGGGSTEEEVALKAKRALVGAGARILFYPTLAYNVFRNKIQSEFRWWDRVDPYVLLGAVPFPSDVPHLQQLGVRGVVTLNEPYETLVPSDLYQAHEIEHLVIPTRDYLFAPSFDDICRAVDFIHKNASCGKTTYVHCKAGRGRSTTIVLCYLIKHKNMTAEESLNHVRSVRPRVLLAPAQWQAVQEYSKEKSQNPSNSISVQESPFAETDKLNLNSNSVKLSELLLPNGPLELDLDLESCFKDRANEDLIMSFFQITHPPRNPCTTTTNINNINNNNGEEEVIITEEDLEGYDMCSELDVSISLENGDVQSKPDIIRRLTCLFGALKVPASCEAPSSPIRAC